VKASSLEMTSGQLDVDTDNLISSTDADPAQRVQIVQLVAHDHVLVKQPGYTARAATAEVNPQAGITQNTTAAPSTAGGKDYRFVQLKGDPTGVTGPVRPEVEVPLTTMDAGKIPTGLTSTAGAATAIITSDEQWLFTSPTTNTYVFSGHVLIDYGIFKATCDLMQVNCSQVKMPDAAAPNSTIQRLAVDNIIAEHNVRIVQGDHDQRVSTADRAVINPREGKAILSGNAVVVDNLKGSRLQNADIILTLTPGNLTEEAVIPPGTPGQPLQRPTIILPDSALHLDEIKKSTEKDSHASAH